MGSLVERCLDEAVDQRRIQGKPSLIVIPDKTRNCAARSLLPSLVARLQQLGVSDGDITFMLANGSHTANSAKEIRAIVGESVASRFKFLQHDSKDAGSLVNVGRTRRGIPVLVNRKVVEAEQVLVVGTAVHHYFAGYGGGPKMIVPGCAGYETITRNHALTIDQESGGIHPQCRPGMLSGNPVQDDIRDALEFVDVDFLLETVLAADGQLAGLFSGELYSAHRLACARVDELFKVEIPHRADLVVASCGGFPKDINLIQAHKAIHNAFQAVRPGGVMIVLAECSQGGGSETFLEWFDYPSQDEMVAALLRNYKLNGTTALALRMKARAARIVLVSELEPDIVRKLGLVPAQNFASAWQLAIKHLQKQFTSYVVPNASLTLPVIAQ